MLPSLHRPIALLWLFSILFFGQWVQAQDLPSCGARPTVIALPRVDSYLWCPERAFTVEEPDELAFTAIATLPDGRLYATRPIKGELYSIEDTDGDGLPDTPFLAADGLVFPNGLAASSDELYILGSGWVYRFVEGRIEVLADDLPGGRGLLASGIALYENRLYIGIPMPCDFCEPDHELQGTVLSMALDGTDRQVIARGLRRPAALAIQEGFLWVTDTARDGLYDVPYRDELNRIRLSDTQIPHFGFPYCSGASNEPDLPGDFDCTQASTPIFTFQTHSNPTALMLYSSQTFPFMTGDLVLTLGGSLNNADMRGHQIAFIEEFEDYHVVDTILPHDSSILGGDHHIPDRIMVQHGEGYKSNQVNLLNSRGAGVWPHRIYGLAMSPQGWLYFSVGGGTIYALRPGDQDPCEYRNCSD